MAMLNYQRVNHPGPPSRCRTFGPMPCANNQSQTSSALVSDCGTPQSSDLEHVYTVYIYTYTIILYNYIYYILRNLLLSITTIYSPWAEITMSVFVLKACAGCKIQKGSQQVALAIVFYPSGIKPWNYLNHRKPYILCIITVYTTNGYVDKNH